MNAPILEVINISKKYRLGEIGSGKLYEDLNEFFRRFCNKDLKKEYSANKGKEFLALDNISFSVNKGERVGIIGRNGAGKSTILKILSQVTAPTDGKIILRGKISSMLEVGTGFNPEMTGRENIYLNGAILGMTRQEISKKFDEILEFSEIGDFIDTPVKRYSSGMYVKLAFSVSAFLNSEILIMDEVLAVGDAAFQKKCIEKMEKTALEQNRTILFVSHNLQSIKRLCERCIVLQKGKIIFDGNTEDAIEKYLSFQNDELSNKVTYDISVNHNKIMAFKEIELLQSNNNLLHFNVHIHNFSNEQKATFRIICKSVLGEPIGMGIISDRKFICGDNVIDFQLDLKDLCEGRYSFDFYIGEFNKVIDNFDAKSALNIEIFNTDLDNDTIKWLPQHWGYYLLNVEEY